MHRGHRSTACSRAVQQKAACICASNMCDSSSCTHKQPASLLPTGANVCVCPHLYNHRQAGWLLCSNPRQDTVQSNWKQRSSRQSSSHSNKLLAVPLLFMQTDGHTTSNALSTPARANTWAEYLCHQKHIVHRVREPADSANNGRLCLISMVLLTRPPEAAAGGGQGPLVGPDLAAAGLTACRLLLFTARTRVLVSRCGRCHANRCCCCCCGAGVG
jgi:hypothetical protein